MPDDVTAAPVVDKPQTDTPEAPATGADKSQGPSEIKSWLDDLPDPLKSSKSLAKFKDVSTLAKSYEELEKKIGRSVEVPSKDAKPEEWAKFLARIGRPEKADDYEFERVDGFEAAPEFMQEVREAFHAAGLTKKQASEVMRFIGTKTASGQKDRAAAREAAAHEGFKALKDAWGYDYDTKIELARRFVERTGGRDALEHLKGLGVDNDPRLLALFAAAGEATGAHKFVTGTAPKGQAPGPYDYMKNS